MAISETDGRTEFTSTGSDTTYTTDFSMYDAGDVSVYFDGVLQTSGFTAALSATAPNTVVITPATSPAAAVKVVLLSNEANDQGITLPLSGVFPSASVVEGLDRGAIRDIQLDEKINRSLRVPVNTSESFNGVLPDPVANKGKVLILNAADGLSIDTATLTTTDIVTPIAAKGDLIVGGASGAAAQKSVGANNTVLIADSTESDGLKYATVAAVLDTLFTTRGDILLRDATAVNRLAIGAADTFLKSDGTDASWGVVDASLPRSYLAGLALSHDTDADHDISIAVGECRDSTDAKDLVLTSAMVKQIDALWSSGTGNGGLFTGTVATNTTYHMFLIRKTSDGSVDAGFDTSVSAANIPSGYVEYRRIGSVLTDSASNIVRFTQLGDTFLWSDPPLDVDTTVGTTSALAAMSVPSAIKVEGRFHVHVGTNGGGLYVSSPDQNDEAFSLTAGPLGTVYNSSGIGTEQAVVWTNTSQQIRYIANGAATVIRIATIGYNDHRGRFD